MTTATAFGLLTLANTKYPGGGSINVEVQEEQVPASGNLVVLFHRATLTYVQRRLSGDDGTCTFDNFSPDEEFFVVVFDLTGSPKQAGAYDSIYPVVA